MLKPFIPVDEAVTKRPPTTESWSAGDEVPIPRYPFALTVNAEMDEVAYVLGDEVEI